MACDAGLIGPVGGFFADIPYPIVGGMVTFLFANVMVSGIIVLSSCIPAAAPAAPSTPLKQPPRPTLLCPHRSQIF